MYIYTFNQFIYIFLKFIIHLLITERMVAITTVIHCSVTRDDPEYWTDGSYDDWLAEMAGARLIVERFANISDGSIIGKDRNLKKIKMAFPLRIHPPPPRSL